jgi:hypothetical protein
MRLLAEVWPVAAVLTRSGVPFMLLIARAQVSAVALL